MEIAFDLGKPVAYILAKGIRAALREAERDFCE